MKRTTFFVVISLLFAFLLVWNFATPAGASKDKRRASPRSIGKRSGDTQKRLLTEKFETLTLPASGASSRSDLDFESKAGRTGDGDADAVGKDGRGDPDMPGLLAGKVTEREFLLRRSEQIARYRGFEPGKPFEISKRMEAVKRMGTQENLVREMTKKAGALQPAGAFDWTPIGPAPIPNGQTQTTVTAVSGRVTAIDVKPTNPLIAYVGTAQGGLYRTLDGGTTWTQLMLAPPIPGGGLSPIGTLAIGAVTIDPTTPTTVFVGTGEGNLSLDSFFGEGVYRIINAETTPTVEGPFESRTNGGNGHAFAGTAINRIIIDPNNNNNMFVGNSLGGSGMSADNFCCGNLNPPSAFIGLYFSANAQAATPTWVRVNPASLPGGGVAGVSDIAIDPTNANILILNQLDFGGGGLPNSGVFMSSNALSGATATYTKPINFAGTQTNAKFAAYKDGATAVFYAATEESSGNLRRSIDAGATWSAPLAAATGFCDGQCFYDIAIDVGPGATTATTDDIVYLAGNVQDVSTKLLDRSDDGGATFGHIDNGLHADSHAVVIAPSNSNVVYTGNDGGIWRSDNAKAAFASVAWSDLNNSFFSATQFVSIAVHPTDANFTIGGTQDNGTPCFGNCGGNAPATWIRADFGDGGFSAIDQNATDTTTVTMYHTYFNATNSIIGFGRVNTTACAVEGEWSFKGRYTGVVDPTVHCDGATDTFNGITITDTVNFYAPLALGPGNPNTVYFGSDRLYRSINKGDVMTVVSQAPLVSSQPISAIAISPQDDNYRMVGLNNGALFFTTTGSAVMTSLDAVGGPSAIPDTYVGRIVFDPTNKNTAYIALNGFTGTAAGVPSTHVWKITNLNTTPVKTSINGSATLFLPDIPVNAFAVDPLKPNRLLAGTDIGVYISEDSGANWTPFGSGLPRIAVFGMAITSSRLLRVATHGLGMWQVPLPIPTAAPAFISGRVTTPDGAPLAGVTMNLSGARTAKVITDSNGNYRFANVDTDNFYTVTPSLVNYHFGPQSSSFSLLANKTDAVFTATRDAILVGNAIDTPDYFVRQHYLDFLGREPDEAGFNFWSDQILSCGTDAGCVERRTINVSAAYFLSIEFQETGGLVDGLYRASYSRRPLFAEFMPDTATVAHGVVVGNAGWAQLLTANRQAFVEAWVQRAAFQSVYGGLTNAGYVDTLISHTGVSFSQSERDALVSGLNSGTLTRADVLRQIAENERFVNAKRNETFVMMEYFGYLRRDPDEPGYQFWLNKLNQFDGDFERAEMVKAFLVSGEYRARFSP